MTLAILLLTAAQSPAPPTLSSGVPLAERLVDQLRRAGAREVHRISGLAELATLAQEADEPLLICGDDLVAHAAVLRHLATSPLPGSVALVLDQPPEAGRSVVAEERGQLLPVRPGGPDRQPTAIFGNALRIAAADLPALAAAARTATVTAADRHPAAVPRPGGPQPSTDDRDSSTGLLPLDALLEALTTAGVMIFTQRVRLLVAQRPADQAAVAAAEAAVAAVDEDRAELRLSVKERDDFFTTYAVSTWSPRVTRLAARVGLSPTGVTAISVAFAIAAAVLFGLGGRGALVTGAILLYLGFVLDCVDGQLARYTRSFSPWGGWLDTMADRAKEYIVYAGLAVGVERAGLGNGWALAIAAIALQTVRHTTDTWYGALHDEAARRPQPSGSGGGLGQRLSRASTRVQADTGSLTYWLKRTVVFPIGERWALIAVTVALFNPLVSLVAVLVWGVLAAAYTLMLRTLRARSMRVAVLPGVDVALHRDDGLPARRLGVAGRRLRWLPGPLPLGLLTAVGSAALVAVMLVQAAAGPVGWPARLGLAAGLLLVVLLAGLPAGATHAGALDWLVPAMLRATEYLLVIAVGLAVGAPGAVVFAALFVLAVQHYDLTARLEKREKAPLWHALRFGWDGRLLLLAVLVALVVGTPATVGMVGIAGYLLVVFAASAIAGWTAVRSAPPG